MQSCCHNPALFVGFSLQEITRYSDFELSLYLIFSFVPTLTWLFHGLNIVRLYDNCLKPLPVEEAFANLYSCLHATLGIDFSDDLMCFLMLCTLEPRRYFFSPVCHDATSVQVDCEK